MWTNNNNGADTDVPRTSLCARATSPLVHDRISFSYMALTLAAAFYEFSHIVPNTIVVARAFVFLAFVPSVYAGVTHQRNSATPGAQHVVV